MIKMYGLYCGIVGAVTAKERGGIALASAGQDGGILTGLQPQVGDSAGPIDTCPNRLGQVLIMYSIVEIWAAHGHHSAKRHQPSKLQRQRVLSVE